MSCSQSSGQVRKRGDRDVRNGRGRSQAILSLPAFPRVRALPRLTSHNLKEKTATRDPGQERTLPAAQTGALAALRLGSRWTAPEENPRPQGALHSQAPSMAL